MKVIKLRRARIAIAASLLFAAPAHAWPWGKYGSRAEAQTACFEWSNAGGSKEFELIPPPKEVPIGDEGFLSRDTLEELQESHRRQIEHINELRRLDAKLRSCRIELDTRQFLGFEKGRKGVVRRFRY